MLLHAPFPASWSHVAVGAGSEQCHVTMRRGATRAERTVSEMAEADDEVREYVRQLEEQAEADADADTLSKASGDEIAADFERYLRRRGTGGAGGG